VNDLSMELEIVGIIDGVDGFRHCFTKSIQNNDVMTSRNQRPASPSIRTSLFPSYTHIIHSMRNIDCRRGAGRQWVMVLKEFGRP
jgi:hypothetical protein